MREVILKRLSPDRSREENVNRLRQFLQIILLKILQESKSKGALAFTGGTALRLLHDLQRFSEDLDFSLIKNEKYDFEQLVEHTRLSLDKLSLAADFKAKRDKTVHHLYIRFREILFDARLSRRREEKLSIRLEIDTNPPAGGKTEVSLLSDFYTFPILHFNLPSSFATKLHACLYRRYTKGRDFYDLMWYLGKKVRPNMLVLNNAIAQTEKNAARLESERLKEAILQKISRLDFARLKQDVAPFLIHQEETALLNADLMQKVVQSYDFTEE